MLLHTFVVSVFRLLCTTVIWYVNNQTYQFQAFEELERLLSNRSICVAVKEKLTKDSGVAGAGDYDHIVEKLLAKPKAKGKQVTVWAICQDPVNT